ncbi:MAG: hypothetical protein IPL63_18620 [Saprospiraceae bacterium]|nr:hypothetical protein [Saprospiraceae bacterium]
MKYKYFIHIAILLSLYQSKICAQSNDIAKHSETTIWSDNLSTEMLNQIVNFNKKSTFNKTGWNDFRWIFFEFNRNHFVDSIIIYVSDQIDFSKTEFSIELNFGETEIQKSINSVKTKYIINENIDELLLLKRKSKSWNFEMVTEIEIYSKSTINLQKRPKTEFSYKKIIQINDKIFGLTDYQIKEKKKNWKSLKRVYKKYLRNHLDKKDREDFDVIISTQNESSYCHKSKYFIKKNDVRDPELLREIVANTNCSFEELYFEFNIDFPNEFYKDFYHYQKDIVYGNKDDIEFLENIVKKGSVLAGDASIHLALMKSYSSYPLIYNLRYDSNVYAQLIALRTCKYFNKHLEAIDIAKSMVQQELDCIKVDTISCYGRYATFASEDLLDTHPSLALEMLEKLYLVYIDFYPENYFEPKYNEDGSYIEQNEENIIPIDVEKRIKSFQLADQQIESKILQMVKKYPHWKENKSVKFILEETIRRRQPITIDKK